eukprot:GHVR01116576.1.p1 GENE.GHVR01116576.1~~GHVR01116576.1.p1  ORF type:complete len:489 (+),score=112.00 GHVR01116576.1:103-1467(+)
MSSLASHGYLSLSNERNKPRQRNLNYDKEIEMLVPASNMYWEFGVELTRLQVTVDLFVAGTQYMDVATLASLVKCTSGDLHYYPAFHPSRQGLKLYEETRHLLKRVTAWESVMRVRVSRGWVIKDVFGHFHMRGSDLLVVPTWNCDKAFSVSLEMHESLLEGSSLCLQCALLYTSSEGERIIRVHTASYPVSQQIADVGNSIDVQCVASSMCLQALKVAVASSNMSHAVSFLQSQCSQICQWDTSRHCSDVVRQLPLLVLGMMKSVAFRATNDVPADLRVFHWTRLECLPIGMKAAYFYPRLMGLAHMPRECGVYGDQIVLPSQLNLSAERLNQEGAFIIEDGESIFLWLGRAVSPQWVRDVFGVASLESVHENGESLVCAAAERGSDNAQRVLQVINELRRQRIPPYMTVTVIRQGDPIEIKFFASLIEDRNPSVGLPLNYSEFLQKIGCHQH